METINFETTLAQLISHGLIESGMVAVWNSRLERIRSKGQQQVERAQITSFIQANLSEGVLYKTKDFLSEVMNQFPEMFEAESNERNKVLKAHNLITLSLKRLVENDVLVVINETKNHAHNRYGLKPNLEEVPEFATFSVNDEEQEQE